MGKLRLYGMRATYDEVLTTAVKRQHEPQQIIGDLLTAEIREKQARSVKYQMTIAKLPLAKELEEFDFEAAPAPAKPILPSVSPAPASEPVGEGGSSMSSTW